MGVLLAVTPMVIDAFGLTGQGAEVLRAFTLVGAGSFILLGGLFVSNAAFNNLGRPGWSTLLGWIKDGVLSWPLATLLAATFGATGVIYGQAVAGALIGGLAAYGAGDMWQALGQRWTSPRLRPGPGQNADRYRRR